MIPHSTPARPLGRARQIVMNKRSILLAVIALLNGSACGSDGKAVADDKPGDASTSPQKLDAGAPQGAPDAAIAADAAGDAAVPDIVGPPVKVLPRLRTLSLDTGCAILPSRELGCWSYYLKTATRSNLVQVDGASTMGIMCSLDASGVVECVYPNLSPVLYTETEGLVFSEIAVGNATADALLCGITLEEAVLCWNEAGTKMEGPAADITEVAMDQSVTSGAPILLDRTGDVFSLDGELAFFEAGTDFVQITTQRDIECGLRSDGAIRCLDDKLNTPSAMRFRRVEAAEEYVCGIRDDQTIACWNSFGDAPPPPPPGDDYVDLAYARKTGMCGIKSDGLVVCAPGVVVPDMPADLRVLVSP